MTTHETLHEPDLSSCRQCDQVAMNASVQRFSGLGGNKVVRSIWMQEDVLGGPTAFGNVGVADNSKPCSEAKHFTRVRQELDGCAVLVVAIPSEHRLHLDLKSYGPFGVLSLGA